MKRDSTSDTIVLEDKHTKAYTTNNMNNYAILSNNDAIKALCQDGTTLRASLDVERPLIADLAAADLANSYRCGFARLRH